MPQPKPKSDETKDDFLGRCMADGQMNDDFPDDDQRFAVCNSIWDNRSNSIKKNMRKETRYLPLDDIEMRVETDDDGNSKLTGYAAVFNRDSVDLGGFIERIMPGAFTETLKSSDVRALFNHDPNMVLGRNTAGTLRMKENSKGLKFEIDLPDTQIARDVAVSVERGDISGSSFSFTTREDVWRTVDGQEIRELIEIDKLFDIGPVAFPAYTDTTVAARSLKEWLDRKDNEPCHQPVQGTVQGEKKAEGPAAEAEKPPAPAPSDAGQAEPVEPPAEDPPPEPPAENAEEPAKESNEKSVDAMAENRKAIEALEQETKDIARADVEIEITKHMPAS